MPTPEMKEYAFDVKLFAAVRVRTELGEEAARAALAQVVDAMEPTEHFIRGHNSAAQVKVTEVSLNTDGEVELFEVLTFPPGQCECANCHWVGGEGDLHCRIEDAPGLHERLDYPLGHLDCVAPAGECPECRCFAYYRPG